MGGTNGAGAKANPGLFQFNTRGTNLSLWATPGQTFLTGVELKNEIGGVQAGRYKYKGMEIFYWRRLIGGSQTDLVRKADRECPFSL